MLEPGNCYTITMLEDHDDGAPVECTWFNRTINEVKWPLIQLTDGTVINLTSPRFIKAEPK